MVLWPVLVALLTAGWIFIGSVSSTSSEFRESTPEAKRREQLPKIFLPIHDAASLTAIENVTQDRPFQKKIHRVIGYFFDGWAMDSIIGFYDAELKNKGWKIAKDKREMNNIFIEATLDDVKGTVSIEKLESGCDLQLSVETSQ